MAFPIPLPHRVTVEYDYGAASDTGGGNVQDWRTLANDVECLISQGSGGEPVQFDQQQGRSQYTLTGWHESLARSDTRFTVTVGPRAGEVLRVVGVSAHGPVEGVIDTEFYRLLVEEVAG